MKSFIATSLAVCMMSAPVNAQGILKGSASYAPKISAAASATNVASDVKSIGLYGEKYAFVGNSPVVLPPDHSELAQPTFTKTKSGAYQASYTIDRKKQYSDNDQAVISIIDSWNKDSGKKTVQVTTKSGTKNVAGTYSAAAAKQLFMSVNEKRTAANVKTLSWDPALYEAANLRAAEISVYNSHTRPDGSSFFTAGKGINGENIADGYETVAIVMNEWMSSPGHKANILRDTFDYFAAASIVVNSHTYWVQNFGGY